MTISRFSFGGDETSSRDSQLIQLRFRHNLKVPHDSVECTSHKASSFYSCSDTEIQVIQMKLSMMSRKAAVFIDTNHRMMMIRQHGNYCGGQSMGVSSFDRTVASMNVMQHPKCQPNMKSMKQMKWGNIYFENHSMLNAATNRCISFYTPTKMMLEKVVVKVPTMGDSITEVRAKYYLLCFMVIRVSC